MQKVTIAQTAMPIIKRGAIIDSTPLQARFGEFGTRSKGPLRTFSLLLADSPLPFG